jgi:hypothetical protein
MLGKSAGVLGLLLLSFWPAACAHNVSQDLHTGPDGKTKGAKAITLDNGEGKVRGIVTYPGGDRVDWKEIELPEKKSGSLDLKLSWKPPRPGLQLGLDLYDQYGKFIRHGKRLSRSKRNRARLLHVDDASGKYYIRVFAIHRGDAGAYKLTADFSEDTGPIQIDMTKVDIPDPPHLAAIPKPEVPCDPYQFDMKNPACRNVCPQTGAPPNWPACKNVCPDPPDVNKVACQRTMACPKPADRRVADCLRHAEQNWPPCNLQARDPNNPRCDHATAPPVTARIINLRVQGRTVLITIAAGADQGITRDWTGHVLRGDSTSELDGGTVTLIRVAKRDTLGKVHLTTDQLSANPRVKLTPPPQ